MKKYSYELDITANNAPARMLRLVGQNKNVLEIGCSTGSQTRLMRNNLNCIVTGVEINATAAEEARPYCQQVIVGDIEGLDLNSAFGNARFDVITFGDVLEHLRDPRAVLEKIKPFLTETGYVVASVPNIAHASVVFELCHGRFDYQPTGLLDDTHIRFFTKRSVTRTFEDAGFLITKLERSEIRPEHTEFKTTASSKEQQELLDYLNRNNTESTTYQFVIQATPLTTASISPASSMAQAATERINELETQLKTSEKSVRELESNLAWLNDRPLAKLYRRIFSRSR